MVPPPTSSLRFSISGGLLGLPAGQAGLRRWGCFARPWQRRAGRQLRGRPPTRNASLHFGAQASEAFGFRCSLLVGVGFGFRRSLLVGFGSGPPRATTRFEPNVEIRAGG
jgi:hypothetical protein